MNARLENLLPAPLSGKLQFLLVLTAVAAFHIAYFDTRFSPLILVYLACILELTRVSTARCAFYTGLALGLLIFVPKLTFFYTIFGPAAVPLWLILAFWHAVFLFLGQRARIILDRRLAIILIPFLWTGLEYFRSELYPLRFSWLSPAFALGPNPLSATLGSYGLTMLLFLLLALAALLRPRSRATASAILLFATVALPHIQNQSTTTDRQLRVAGIQLEFPAELEVPAKLDILKQKHPNADIYVLSEYTFDGPIPKCVRAWCKRNSKYLIAGGKDTAPIGDFYNTAFVVDPNGEIIFKQAKAVPIQFFKDGLPAPHQAVWNSPWGKIGLAICYDLSYTRVIDDLAGQGAQVIINPTMDLADWGATQHQLHSRIPPMRAAEYGIPIFRLASSGVSQAIDARGRVLASAPFPGEESVLAATLPLANTATLHLDRVLAPAATAFTILFIASLALRKLTGRSSRALSGFSINCLSPTGIPR